MRVRVLAALLFCSGAGALVLEVAWFRRLAQVAGATSVALGAVLAAVIGGMALGAYLFGKTAQASPRPLRLYAKLEAIIAALAIATPWLLSASEAAFVGLTRALGDLPVLLLAARFLLSVLLLAPAAICMGGTLPAMAAAMKRDAKVGSGVGLLYAFNTFGAVLGTVTAGFFLLPALGLANTMRAAALFSGLAALIAFVLKPGQEPATWTSVFGEGDDETPTSFTAQDRARAIRLFAYSGFLGMAAEGAFVRGLVLVFGSTTYAFTIMLSIFLFGIALGGTIGTRMTGPNSLKRLGQTVAWTAGLLGLGALSIYLLPRVYLIGYDALGSGFGAGIVLRAVMTSMVLLPGAIGLGIAFPLAADVAASEARAEGTGRLYAANALASVLGSTCAVFFLFPYLGPAYTVAVAGLLVSALAFSETRNPAQLAPLVLVLGAFWPPSDVMRERLLTGIYLQPGSYLVDGEIDEYHWGQGRDVSFYEWGREATVSIERWYGAASIYVNGKTVASGQNVIEIQHLATLGHLPMVLHPDPKKVLVIGLGMGTTYESILVHEPEEITLVELEGAVANAAATLGVRPPKLVIDDGRAYMRATNEKYDIVSSDTIHPWVRGGGDMYTLEYFQSCRDVMAPGGLICHWLPLYQMSLEDVKAVVRTFAKVFRTYAFFSGTNISLVGALDDTPLQVYPPRSDAARAALVELGMLDTMDLLVFGPEDTAAAVGPGHLVTEDGLQLEFSTPRHLRSPEKPAILDWMRASWKDPAPPYGALMDAIAAGARGDTRGYADALERAAQESPDNGFVRRYRGEAYMKWARHYMKKDEFPHAWRYLEMAKEHLPDDNRLIGVESEIAAAEGKLEDAIRLQRELVEKTQGSAYLDRRMAMLEELLRRKQAAK